MSKFSQNPDWKKHASNYVAKRYFKEEERETYFADTKLQMEAKLYGEEYNKMNPPKKVWMLKQPFMFSDALEPVLWDHSSVHSTVVSDDRWLLIRDYGEGCAQERWVFRHSGLSRQATP